MDTIYKYILESITEGNIEKQTAIRLLSMLKKKGGQQTKDIAIIGIGVKLPAVTDLREFWDIILSRGSFPRSFPESRKVDATDYISLCGYDNEPVFAEGAYLEHIDNFDYEFFRIPPKEAELMDPNQRLLLETVLQTIEDGGYGGGKLAGSKTGVFVGYEGSILDSYGKMIYQACSLSSHIAIPGNLPSVIAGRVSHLFDLKGPSIIVDCACSSSLVAVDLACQALESGSCRMAIAAGIKVNFLPLVRDVNLGIESSDGITRAFDYHADGTGEGEGIAAVLLKPLEEAVMDRDNIHAVIKGHAVNQDGYYAGITSPNPSAQADVITEAWNRAGVDPETIRYIEVHGTGTSLGDPIEIKGLQEAFKRYTKKRQFCAISSVKSNLGHLFECAGIINLITAVLALKNGMIPPSAYFNRPNAEIDFCQSPVYINIKPQKWEGTSSLKRCGVSAYGISGTNCHVVLEEAPEIKKGRKSYRFDKYVFTISADSDESLTGLIRQYADFFDRETGYSIEDICFTAGTGRGHYSHRTVILVKDMHELRHSVDFLSKLTPDQIKNTKKDNIFYGFHKVVSGNKKTRQDGEITREFKRTLGEEAERCLKQYIITGEEELLRRVCALYACGADPDWNSLYSGVDTNRVSLPAYFFQRKRCWINIAETKRFRSRSLFHQMVWTKSDEQSYDRDKTAAAAGTILVLKDEGLIADRLIERLAGDGHSVIEASVRDRFERTDPGIYTIGPDRDSIVRLVEEIGSRTVSKVVNLVNISFHKEIDSVRELKERQRKGFDLLLYLIQALMERYRHNSIEFLIFTSNAVEVTGTEEELNPEYAPLTGIGSVASMEYPNIVCRCIDIDKNAGIDNILYEINKTGDRLMAAYRNGIRFVRRFETKKPENIAYRATDIREGGTYLITGGTGGIGLEICRYLASRARVKLALVSRTGFPERNEWDTVLANPSDSKTAGKIRIIRDILSTGSEVRFYRADVSDSDEIRSVVERIRQECGSIRGIFHCAGITGAGLIAEKTLSEAQTVLNPKIYGTWLIHKLTEADAPDFMVLFSSVASIGGAGQSDYAAANNYLDAFSSYRNRLGLKTLAINWAPWKETGMWLENKWSKIQMFHELPTDQAIAALDILINSDTGNMFVGCINYNAQEIRYFRDKMSFRLSDSIAAILDAAGRPSAAGGGKDPDKDIILSGKGEGAEYTRTERTVAAIWNEVLGLGKFDVYDNFYEMGGDSIKALSILNLLNQKMDLVIKPSDLFSNPTIHQFAAYLDSVISGSLPAGREESIYSGLVPVEKRAYYPLSSAQKRLFIIDRAAKSKSYNITRAYKIEGNIDLHRLENALNELIRRHESLRTSFSVIDGIPYQIVHDCVDFKIEYEDCDENSLNEKIQGFVDYFDLEVPKLLRVKIFNISSMTKVIVFDMHHIITDGASMDIMISELACLYQGRKLHPLPVQYRDYAVWQQELLNNKERKEYEIIKRQEKYWLEIYHDKIPVLDLPADFRRPAERTFKGSYVMAYADEQMSEAVRKLAQDTQTTLNMVLLTAYYIFLSRCTGAEDVIVGIPIAGRQHSALEKMVGLLVNTVALRAAPTAGKRISEFLTEIKRISLEMQENQDYQFDDLVSRLDYKRENNRNALFDTMFVLQNVGLKTLDIDGVIFSPYEFDTGVAKFDLLLEVFERGGTIAFRWEYSTDLFRRKTVERFARDYLSVLDAIIADRDAKIGDIDLLDGYQYRKAALPDENVEFDF